MSDHLAAASRRLLSRKPTTALLHRASALSTHPDGMASRSNDSARSSPRVAGRLTNSLLLDLSIRSGRELRRLLLLLPQLLEELDQQLADLVLLGALESIVVLLGHVEDELVADAAGGDRRDALDGDATLALAVRRWQQVVHGFVCQEDDARLLLLLAIDLHHEVAEHHRLGQRRVLT